MWWRSTAPVRCKRGPTWPAKRTETRGETVFFYLDSASAQTLVQALAPHHGLRVLHRPANLEDLFLKLTGRQIRDE
jgi:lipooligosaccharide transport system ATP-binding protein